MNTIPLLFLLVRRSSEVFAQWPQPGFYLTGLTLGYDSTFHKVTGSFEDATGWDEELKTPRFSCIFYFEGEVKGG